MIPTSFTQANVVSIARVVSSMGSSVRSAFNSIRQAACRLFQGSAAQARPSTSNLGEKAASVATAQPQPSMGSQPRDSVAAASFARQDGVPPEGKASDPVVLRAAPKEGRVGRAIEPGSAEHFELAKKWTEETVIENLKSGSYLSLDDGFRGDGVLLKDCHVAGYERATKAIPAVAVYLREVAGLNPTVGAIVPAKVEGVVTPEAEILEMTRFLTALADRLENGATAFLGSKACQQLREMGTLVDKHGVQEGSYLFVRSMVPFRMLGAAVMDAVGASRGARAGAMYGILCTSLGKGNLEPKKVLSGAAGQVLAQTSGAALAEGLNGAFARASMALHAVINQVAPRGEMSAARPESKHSD